MSSQSFHRELKHRINGLKKENEELNNKMSELQSKIEELNKEIHELKEQNLRFSADVENFQKATESKIREMENNASVKVINDLLPILDSLDNATDDNAKALRLQFLSILKKQGLEIIDNANVPFDPNIHEAIGVDEGGRDGYITKIVRNGYKFKGRLIRPALVLIGKEVK